jgi:hypothetical protein
MKPRKIWGNPREHHGTCGKIWKNTGKHHEHVGKYGKT